MGPPDPRAENGAPAGAIKRSIPILEWIVAAIGAALVVGAIAFLVLHALGRNRTPPDVRLVAESVLELRNGYLVRYRAFNEGSQAAAQLLVEGTLGGATGVLETSEATIDYLPPRSGRTGGLFFTRDPRRFDLELRAKGYTEP